MHVVLQKKTRHCWSILRSTCRMQILITMWHRLVCRHPTSCASIAEIMSTLFFHTMRYKVSAPKDASSDRFVLSKGHAAPILYAGNYIKSILFLSADHVVFCWQLGPRLVSSRSPTCRSCARSTATSRVTPPPVWTSSMWALAPSDRVSLSPPAWLMSESSSTRPPTGK